MKFELPPLPYSKDALSPYINTETVELHYEKHHRGYLNKLQKAIADKPTAQKSLEEIIQTSEGGIFNNAAQVWNHTFYWNSMTPGGGGAPKGDVAAAIDKTFGSYDSFREQFASKSVGQFGSGYTWLYLDGGKLVLETRGNADTPIREKKTPVLGIDLWEHAYYLDFHHERNRYIDAVLDHLINWEFANKNFAGKK